MQGIMRVIDRVAATCWFALLLALVSGCADIAGPEGVGTVAVRFSATGNGSALDRGAMDARFQASGDESLTIAGSNGVLTITDIRLIVSEFELKREDEDECDDDASGGDDDACEEFEGGPAFVDVPLAGGSVVVVSQAVPAGTYDELEFEVEDLEDDEDDEDAQRIAEVMAEVRAAFPEWPEEASLLVEGSFQPEGGEARSFRAFFEAEIEVERELVPPLVVDAGGSPDVTVELDAARWFLDGQGRVLDLSQFDFEMTGRVVEFEVEIEEGIDVEWEDD
ncbi:MAG: hypothetical protein ACRELV_13295 [Longimicrobiales bacterium]